MFPPMSTHTRISNHCCSDFLRAWPNCSVTKRKRTGSKCAFSSDVLYWFFCSFSAISRRCGSTRFRSQTTSFCFFFCSPISPLRSILANLLPLVSAYLSFLLYCAFSLDHNSGHIGACILFHAKCALLYTRSFLH